MSAKWIRVETDFVDHPKVLRLAVALGGTEAEAGWYVLRAWSWLSRFCPTGQLRDTDRDALESACRWRGAPGELLAAMVCSEWLETWDIDGTRAGWAAHDWPEHQGKVADKAAKERDRKRAYREKKRAAVAATVTRDTGGTHGGTNAGRPAQRDVTGRDVTGRDVSSSYEDDGPAAPPSPAVGFYERFQATRQGLGWAHEEPPTRAELEEFFSGVAEQLDDTLEGAKAALEVACRGYAKDPYWLQRALPWAGFVKQWRRYVRSGLGDPEAAA